MQKYINMLNQALLSEYQLVVWSALKFKFFCHISAVFIFAVLLDNPSAFRWWTENWKTLRKLKWFEWTNKSNLKSSGGGLCDACLVVRCSLVTCVLCCNLYYIRWRIFGVISSLCLRWCDAHWADGPVDATTSNKHRNEKMTLIKM